MDVRQYRSVGGPWHGEQHELDGRLEWYVPIQDNRDIDGQAPSWALTASVSTLEYVGIRCAVYRLDGDYAAERFYRFIRIERR